MAKKPKKADRSGRGSKSSNATASGGKTASVFVRPLSVRQVGPRHQAITFAPTVLESLDPPEPIPKIRRRKR